MKQLEIQWHIISSIYIFFCIIFLFKYCLNCPLAFNDLPGANNVLVSTWQFGGYNEGFFRLASYGNTAFGILCEKGTAHAYCFVARQQVAMFECDL